MNKFLVYILAALLLITCRDPFEGELGDPSSKIDGIHGAWELATVVQTDEKAPDKRQLDLTSYYQNFVLEFNKEDFSYHLDTTLEIQGKNLFRNSGTWTFYNTVLSEYDLVYPDMLQLENDEGFIELNLLKPIRVVDQTLELKLIRICEEEAMASYELIFNRL